MLCTTVKDGVDCVLMTKKGCGFAPGACMPIIDDCQGCARAGEFGPGVYCQVYPDPPLKWKRGMCNMATHVKPEQKAEAAKVNPLKASKRAARGGRR